MEKSKNQLKYSKKIFILIVSIISIGSFLGYRQYKLYVAKSLEAKELIEYQNMIKERELTAKRDVLLKDADTLFQGYYVDEAIALLNKDKELQNEEILSKIKEYENYKSAYVLYTDNVEHIFFHSLVLYPEYLFKDITKPTGGINEGFSYQRELKRMLPQLLERGYVLYNINDVFAKDENGIMRQKEIYLPVGKKPLILSIDDPTYATMGTDNIGFANRMILDSDGNLATEVITPNHETIITYDGDVELVVDNFVKEHPEFSYRGARGIVAATGFKGIFGHDLSTDESKNEAIAVVNKLKENGWLFASHSYTHNRKNFWSSSGNATNIAWDVKEWRKIMGPIVGDTNIFISPFGYTAKGSSMDAVINNGFDIYCNVTSSQKISVNDRYALMGRIEIGGYSMNRYTKYLNEHFFDVSSVIDSYRPPISK